MQGEYFTRKIQLPSKIRETRRHSSPPPSLFYLFSLFLLSLFFFSFYFPCRVPARTSTSELVRTFAQPFNVSCRSRRESCPKFSPSIYSYLCSFIRVLKPSFFFIFQLQKLFRMNFPTNKIHSQIEIYLQAVTFDGKNPYLSN